jgi:hypothetical protein
MINYIKLTGTAHALSTGVQIYPRNVTSDSSQSSHHHTVQQLPTVATEELYLADRKTPQAMCTATMLTSAGQTLYSGEGMNSSEVATVCSGEIFQPSKVTMKYGQLRNNPVSASSTHNKHQALAPDPPHIPNLPPLFTLDGVNEAVPHPQAALVHIHAAIPQQEISVHPGHQTVHQARDRVSCK